MSTLRSKVMAQALWSLVIDDKRSGGDVAGRFVTFLEENNLFHMASAVVRHLERLSLEYEAEHTLWIRAAHPISAGIVDAIKSRMRKVPKEAQVAIKEDPDILGGFIADYGETVYDASVRNQLSALRRKLLS